jgi:hypothetical protein
MEGDRRWRNGGGELGELESEKKKMVIGTVGQVGKVGRFSM